MATLEAMTAGLVPVMSDAGDAFLLTHADCGVVIARNAPRAFGRGASVELLGDPGRLQACGTGRSSSPRSWTVDDMVAATEDVYRSVLARHVGRLRGSPAGARPAEDAAHGAADDAGVESDPLVPQVEELVLQLLERVALVAARSRT